MAYYKSQHTFREIKVEGYERVVEVMNEKAGLHALIALHNASLGPALGGTRIYPYASFDEALEDVLRLSKGMTYKAAIAKTGTGGGKSVIIADHRLPKPEKMLLAFAEVVNAFEGAYICAEDMGVNGDDLSTIRKGTQYIVGIPHEKSSGDPCPVTAFGVYRAIQAVCKKKWGSESVKGRTLAIQGIGGVGMKLAEMLYKEGAHLLVADIEKERIAEAQKNFRALVLPTHEILQAPCDILVPCARGGILNSATIPTLKCKAICGATNNQLLEEEDDERLFAKGILYAPDFVANAGGLINVVTELEEKGYDKQTALNKVSTIYDQLLEIFDLSDKQKKPTHRVACDLADRYIAMGTGKRVNKVIYHH